MMTEKVLDILKEHTVLVTIVEVFCAEISLQAEDFYPKVDAVCSIKTLRIFSSTTTWCKR
jgi:hypothetical protein